MKKVLIFKMGNVAYASTRVFAETFGGELEKKNVSVTYFDFKKETSETLEALSGQSYDAVIDFNSRLPGAIQDGAGYFLDSIDAPFFNYILDHPVYHHANLNHQLKNYHVICIDNDHAAYVKKWYPHIKSVQTAPVGAIRAEGAAGKKEQTILFPATYLNPHDYYAMLKELPAVMKDSALEMIEILFSDTACTYEEAAMQVYQRKEESMEFPVFAQSNFLADIYVRAYFREKVLETLAKSGLPMKVCGEKYQQSKICSFKNVAVLPQVSYRESLTLIQQSAFVLNVMPWFKSGIHDRVLNAMINGAVCITDSSNLLEQYFIAQRDYIGYSLDCIEELPQIVCALMADSGRQSEIAACAYKKAAYMTFAKTAELLITELSAQR